MSNQSKRKKEKKTRQTNKNELSGKSCLSFAFGLRVFAGKSSCWIMYHRCSGQCRDHRINFPPQFIRDWHCIGMDKLFCCTQGQFRADASSGLTNFPNAFEQKLMLRCAQRMNTAVRFYTLHSRWKIFQRRRQLRNEPATIHPVSPTKEFEDIENNIFFQSCTHTFVKPQFSLGTVKLQKTATWKQLKKRKVAQ